MVQVKAPSQAAGSTPLDLVAVLDVSGSMAGPKLEEVKRAMGLVVDSLGARDRLSVVAFSDDARRVVPPTRMSGDGKAAARLAVESLVAAGSTNIRAGLDEAAKVLEECQHDGDVAGVILLSDGYDNYSACRRSLLHRNNPTDDYSDLLPPYLVLDKGWRGTPVHTFAWGSDHDEEALHGISAATGGTFSFIENHASIQDALPPCVGGLRSNSGADDEEAWVSVGELYADEERRFLFFFDVQSTDDADYDSHTERLFKVSCEYMDMATGQVISVRPADEYTEVLRTLDGAPEAAPSMEVERERLRVEAAEDVALAHAAAERVA
ncbi:E3 ubiquitin-protein ligase WAV3-like [Panicum virgatum]|uniref:E3 ubiquitin-protein ligase WAV3-like n=1 Tax=Panicum virgatum TaxID=38727 RepID=UPI0019D51A0C|nr:E3 ubiquitin-protein ligase WAV3-like [Panicum virgatum]